MNNEILLPNRCHNFAKSGLLRLYSRESASAKLFPLDRSRGLGREIIQDAVDAFDLGGDAADDAV